jgi:DNA processing protein
VFESLEPYPAHIDDIARKLSIEPGRLSSILLQLELKGIAQQSPGKFFSKIEKV